MSLILEKGLTSDATKQKTGNWYMCDLKAENLNLHHEKILLEYASLF